MTNEYEWDDLKKIVEKVFNSKEGDQHLALVIFTLMKRIEELEESLTSLSDEMRGYDP